MLSFNNEMLIPKINGEIYFSIYEVENWLRRICLTAYMLEYGSNWYDEIPGEMYKRLETTLQKNNKLLYNSTETAGNLIWITSIGELLTLMENDNNIMSRIERLIICSNEQFIVKIRELKDMRNVLAHNRALSEKSEVIFNGIMEALNIAIYNFKQEVLYLNNLDIYNDDSNYPIANYFYRKMKERNWKSSEAFIGRKTDFYVLYRLPRLDDKEFYISGKEIINSYDILLEKIMAIIISKEYSEYAIITPVNISEFMIKKIIDKFSYDSDVWTDKSYEKQNPKYICNPKIWFYEFHTPTDE